MSFSSPVGGPIATAFVEVNADTGEASRDVLKFIADLRLVDEAAARAGEQIENHFQEAARTSDRALRDIGGTAIFTPVTTEAEVAGERIENSFQEAARQSNEHLASIRTGLGLLAGAAGLAAGAAVLFGLKSTASLEQTTISFESLLGSAQAANDMIVQIQQFAATTPFEFQGLADNIRSLLAVQDSLGLVQADLFPTITAIGDLTSVLGQPPEAIDRVVRALSQMGSKGKITTEELLQIGEAVPGFPVFQAMADGLGISTAALQDQLAAGSIPATEGIKVLIDSMRQFPGAAGAMAKQSQTLTGLLSTFKDTISITLTQALSPLIPVLKDTLAAATPIIQGFVQGFGAGLQALLPAFQGVFGAIGPLVAQLGPTLTALAEAANPLIVAFATLVGTIGTPFLRALGEILVAITPLTTAIGGAVSSLVTAVSPVVETLFDAIGSVFTALAPVVTNVVSLLSDTLGPVFQEIAPLLEDTLQILGQGLVDAINIAAPSIQLIAQALGENLAVVLEGLAPVMPQLAEAFAQLAVAGANLLVAFTPLLVKLIELNTGFFNDVQAPILMGIANAIVFLANGFSGMGGAVSPLIAVFDAFKTVVMFLWQNVFVPFGDFISAIFIPVFKAIELVALGPLAIQFEFVKEAASALWRNVFEPLSTFISSVFHPTVSALSGVFGVLGAVVSGVSSIFSGVKGPIDAVTGAIGGALTFAINVAKDAWGRFSGAIDAVKGPLSSIKDFIQGVIDKIGSLIDRIKDIPGAGIVSNAIGHLPGFQGGGIIGQDMIAQLHAPEVVIPLNEPDRALELARQSGLLGLLAQAGAGTGATSGSAIVGGGVTIGTLQVNFSGDVSRANAEQAASVIADSLEATLRRRQLSLAVRTIGAA